MIEELIPQPQSYEIVRDRIAEIIAATSAHQMAIAADKGEDPALYALRVFTERSNPIGEWTFTEDDDPTPIVNVIFSSMSVGGMDGDVVRRQSYEGTYHIDCYGYSVSFETEDHEFISADEYSAREAQRAAGLVRAILMAGQYTYLGFPRGTRVGRRWIGSMTAFERQADERSVQSIQGVRVTLSVRLEETSPQVQGVPLEGIDIAITRDKDGQILAELEIGEADSL